jgi:hypothetical protein
MPLDVKLPQKTGLLKLPLEVLQLCLTHATTPSFLQLIATCHTLWEVAANTRAVILHHLAQVPGIKLGIDDFAISTPELFLILRRRAALNLFGAHMRADRVDYTFLHSSFDASASYLWAKETFRIALVADNAMRVYESAPGRGLVRKAVTVPNSNLCVLRTAIDQRGDIAVLYLQSAIAATVPKEDRKNAFVLVYHQWSGNSYKPVLFPYVHGFQDYVPVSLAAFKGVKVAIASNRGHLSRHAHSQQADAAVFCYHLKCPAGKLSPSNRSIAFLAVTEFHYTETRSFCETERPRFDDIDEGSISERRQLYPPESTTAIDLSSSDAAKLPLPKVLRPPPVKVVFTEHGRDLKCYAAGFSAPSFRLDTVDRALNDEWAIGKVHIGSYDFLIDSLFYAKHESDNEDGIGRRRCKITYLALGITKTFETVDESRLAACIIRVHRIVSYTICSHVVDMDINFRTLLRAEVVGRLWGYNQAPATSLPGVVAYSRNGSRIAIADWDKILVWALNGEALVDGNTGSQYYDMVQENKFEQNHVVLKPILLKAGSVVRQMAFGRMEDELAVLTSEGLQIWNLGPSGTGKRELHHLDEWDSDCPGLDWTSDIESRLTGSVEGVRSVSRWRALLKLAAVGRQRCGARFHRDMVTARHRTLELKSRITGPRHRRLRFHMEKKAISSLT